MSSEATMNTEKLVNMLAVGVREEDILDVLGCSIEEYQQALADPGTQLAVKQAKQERYQNTHDVNEMWDQMERIAGGVVLETLMTNPDPSFALAAATQANKMRRRDVGTGQIQPIHAQQNNVVVIRLNQSFTERLNERDVGDFLESEPGMVSSEGMPKDVDAMPLQDAERVLLPVETVEAEKTLEDLLEDIQQPVTMDVRR